MCQHTMHIIITATNYYLQYTQVLVPEYTGSKHIPGMMITRSRSVYRLHIMWRF